MASYRKKALAVAAAASMSVALAACGGGSDNNSSNSSSSGEASKGGTLTYYIRSALEHTDPQRTYVGRDITNWSRTVYRSLVTFPISEDAAKATTPVPDLATDIGTSSEGGKVWSFTLKDGIKWEDGSEITCEDFKYGASRAFADDVLTGGAGFYLTGSVEKVGTCRGIVSLVVVEAVEVVVTIEHPLRSAVVHQSVAQSRERTFFQRRSREQHRHVVRRTAHGGSYHVAFCCLAAVAIATRAVVVVFTTSVAYR
jgi:ABC-type transport system substrate-binding protein